MQTVRTFITTLESNHYTSIVVGLLMFSASIMGIEKTFVEDVKNFNFHHGHGTALFGLWYSILSIGRLFNDLGSAKQMVSEQIPSSDRTK